jgi:hypothetical protein
MNSSVFAAGVAREGCRPSWYDWKATSSRKNTSIYQSCS